MTTRAQKYSIGRIRQLVVGLLVHSVNPQKAVLFGSYAYGWPNKNSDLDLLVILKNPRDRMKRYVAVSK